MWEQSSTEIDKMTVKQFLDMLTDWNWHTERVLIETIIDGRDDLINRACKVRLQHSKDGHLTDENWKERMAIIKEMENEND